MEGARVVATLGTRLLLVVRTEFGSVVSPEDIPQRMKFVVEGDIDSRDTPIPEAGGSQHLLVNL